MLIDGGKYKDVRDRVFTINIQGNDVYVDILEGPSFSNNPLSRDQVKAWLEHDFWRFLEKPKTHITKIEENYNI